MAVLDGHSFLFSKLNHSFPCDAGHLYDHLAEGIVVLWGIKHGGKWHAALLVHLANEDNLPFANAAIDRFREAHRGAFNDLEILRGEHPETSAKLLETLILGEDIDRNLAVRFPPPAITKLQKQFAHALIGDEIDDIHADELVIAVLDNTEVFLVVHHAVGQKRKLFEDFQYFGCVVSFHWFYLARKYSHLGRADPKG